MRSLFGWPTVFFAAAVALSLLAGFNQVKALGLSWQEENYLPHLKAAANNPAYTDEGDGPLSAAIALAAVRVAEALHLPRPEGLALVALRVAQNMLLLAVVYGYCRALMIPRYTILLGWMALTWAMTYAAYNTTLAFDSYTETILCVCAAWAMAAGRASWTVPLAFIAALNRETGWVLPLLVWAATIGGAAGGVSTTRRYTSPIVCALAYAAGAMAMWSGYRPEVQGNALLFANLESGRVWGQLAATFGVLPFLAILGWRNTPLMVQCIAALTVPILFIWHFTHSPATATHYFMTPLVVCALPMALLALGGAPYPAPASAK